MKNKSGLGVFLRLAWSISPSYIILLVINAIVSACSLLVNVVLPKYLIDELMTTQNVTMLIVWGCAIVGSNFLFAFLVKTMDRLLKVRNVYMIEEMLLRLSQKLMNIEYACLENPYYLDLKERAKFAITNQSALLNLINASTDCLKQIAIVIGLLVIMFQLSIVLVVILIVTVGLMVFIQLSFSKFQMKFFQELLPVNRRYGYYVNMCFEDVCAKDFRLYGMGDMMGKTINKYNVEIASWFSKMKRKQGVMMGLYQAVVAFQTAVAYGYVGARCLGAFGKAISIGSMTMYVSSAINFSSSVFALGYNTVIISQMLNYLKPFVELMSLPEQTDLGGKEHISSIDSVRFENVSFTYPNTSVKVLDNISFEVGRGEKISIVGLNGAGKTTLVKLLTRLYKADSGKIFVNDRDIFDYDYGEFVDCISAVFQDYKLFAFSIEENITCKPLGADRDTALDIVEKVGMKDKIESLPSGIATLLGKHYDENGVEMSGGQNQKIAIARALYKNASLIILDEPTSALDPISEAEIYEQFNSLVGVKTAIYISHRMSSSVFCDKVLIIDGGRVADYDTHVNLMKKTDSLYYKMFTAQAVNYKK